MFLLSLIFVFSFALAHYMAKYMSFLSEIPRSRYLSAAGGIAVSYVFLHLLPEVSESQEVIHEAGIFSSLSNHAYLLALLGLFLFYALDQRVKTTKTTARQGKKESSAFWIHVASFFFYNALIGYLLIKEEFHSVFEMSLYFFAMLVHFITVDHNLRSEHKDVYDRYGRWILSVAIVIGWFIGLITDISEYMVSLLVAFLAGGIILNVIKEELPEEKESSLGAFAMGIVGYSLLLLFLD
ncbi:hypothetical protein [Halobacillus yeomjeoni]|uniref:ZIP Zinc transporter n=1 Tax=Halobacillus yeomjeoni TaxID=311194 RepID=A0A931HTX1_9BACI|nr:hypothetical protein [Halobacillus yeomjeoni]MBH0229670.1 hypothetical protein [Halobacillus yeomjeoni]